MAGGMEANKNKFIEDWGSARETLEQNFRWTRRNFALIGLFGIALPVLVYKGIVKEFVISISLPPFLVSYVIFEVGFHFCLGFFLDLVSIWLSICRLVFLGFCFEVGVFRVI
ncbi:hypothetical protein OIU84_011308 [Salix udensis]|uniref:Uncharacterized protein n=1 Tax=Salix udensis TaxID=889485 RepID=A0AAD6JNE0_9ROSI|nr:hypothetical protein OIU84_011308 [Salix udensis]